MVYLQDLPEHIISDKLAARYLIITGDTIVARIMAMDANSAKYIRDRDYPGHELGLIVPEKPEG